MKYKDIDRTFFHPSFRIRFGDWWEYTFKAAVANWIGYVLVKLLPRRVIAEVTFRVNIFMLTGNEVPLHVTEGYWEQLWKFHKGASKDEVSIMLVSDPVDYFMSTYEEYFT